MTENTPVIKQKPIEELNTYQESLLRKRKKDDADQRRRIDARAKQKLQQARQKKADDKEYKGANILMPEVFVSNHMKQQRNYVHYKRNKNKLGRAEKASSKFGGDLLKTAQIPSSSADTNSLLLVVRIKGLNQGTTPQAQKILSDLGLRQINNAVF